MLPDGLTVFAPIATAFMVSLVVTAGWRWQSVRFGLLDIPNVRSSHQVPTPRGGGVGFVLPIIGTAALYAAWGFVDLRFATALSVGGLIIAATGMIDDWRPLPVSVRLCAQITSALVVAILVKPPFWADIGATGFSWTPIIAVFSAIGIVWMINLTNFMDGIDGLAASEILFAAGFLALLPNSTGASNLMAIAAAAVAGFLVFNWAPASIFMGDVGSGFLGFFLGAFLYSADTRTRGAAIILLAVFVADATITLIRRFLQGERLTQAHRGHAYQLAAQRWGHRRVVLFVWAINLMWLAPLSWAAWSLPHLATVITLVAYLPVVAIVSPIGLRLSGLAPRRQSTAQPSRLVPIILKILMSSSDILDIRLVTKAFSRHRHWILLGIQLAAFLLAGTAAFLLRFDFIIPKDHRTHLVAGLVAWGLAKVLVFRFLGLDHGWWRYVSVPDLVRLFIGNMSGSVIACIALLYLAPEGFPRSLYILDFILCFLMTAGIRMAVRIAYEYSRTPSDGIRKRTLIYGAGAAGMSLLRELHQNPSLHYDVVGFIDDSPAKAGGLIQRTKIFGDGAMLPGIVRSEHVDLVLIALPSATGAQMSTVLRHCHEARVANKTVPGLAKVIQSSGLASQIRDIDVEDLLGRNPIDLDRLVIRSKIEGQVIAVTGAAGSIGSELCRQIAACAPAVLVAIDIAETPLFHIERELRAAHPDLRLYPEIASIQNIQRVNEIFAEHSPNLVYHAAAYKHVPMMEANVFEAIENNIIGTYNVGVAAARYGVDDFVMISSDKAVRPSSIMGATKRGAEVVIRSLQNGGPRYVSVRFGNVLGSNGSVVPIFKQQIACGGPVTVTHPEMRRYFMTITEAVQLVLQASTMGQGGEIFVLNMGKPVRIVDLARQLIVLSGLTPDVDVRIEFTGIRPGEKLCEELRSSDEDVLSTAHDKIKIFAGLCPSESTMADCLAQLRRACERRDFQGAVFALKAIAPDYTPSQEVLARALGGDLERFAGAVGNSSDETLVPSALSLVSGD